MTTPLVLGQNIQSLRRKLALTQSQLAERAQLTVGTISRAERGAMDLRISAVEKIADALTLYLHWVNDQ